VEIQDEHSILTGWTAVGNDFSVQSQLTNISSPLSHSFNGREELHTLPHGQESQCKSFGGPKLIRGSGSEH